MLNKKSFLKYARKYSAFFIPRTYIVIYKHSQIINWYLKAIDLMHRNTCMVHFQSHISNKFARYILLFWSVKLETEKLQKCIYSDTGDK